MTLSKNCYLLAIGFIIISTQQSVAQNEVLFQVKFKPNKTYITEMVNIMQMDMNFDIDSAKKKGDGRYRNEASHAYGYTPGNDSFNKNGCCSSRQTYTYDL